MLNAVGIVLTVVSALLTFGVWLASIYYGYKAAVLRKDGIGFLKAALSENMAFEPASYTADGQYDGRRCFQMIGLFFALAIITGLLSAA